MAVSLKRLWVYAALAGMAGVTCGAPQEAARLLGERERPAPRRRPHLSADEVLEGLGRIGKLAFAAEAADAVCDDVGAALCRLGIRTLGPEIVRSIPRVRADVRARYERAREAGLGPQRVLDLELARDQLEARSAELLLALARATPPSDGRMRRAEGALAEIDWFIEARTAHRELWSHSYLSRALARHELGETEETIIALDELTICQDLWLPDPDPESRRATLAMLDRLFGRAAYHLARIHNQEGQPARALHAADRLLARRFVAGRDEPWWELVRFERATARARLAGR